MPPKSRPKPQATPRTPPFHADTRPQAAVSPHCSAALPLLDAHDDVPPTIIKSLPQRDVARRRLPDAVVLVEDGQREVGGGGEAYHLVVLLVVVAGVDGRVGVAAQARAAPAARLTAERGGVRVVAAQVLDALFEPALVGVFVAGYVAADYVRLKTGGRRERCLLAGCSYFARGGEVGMGMQSTNQFALGESVGRIYSHAQLGEEEEGEEEHVHCEDVFVILMVVGHICLRRRRQGRCFK